MDYNIGYAALYYDGPIASTLEISLTESEGLAISHSLRLMDGGTNQL